MNFGQQSRRQRLQKVACGFGSIALAGLCDEADFSGAGPLAPKEPMFPARAKRVIFLFMQGGPSVVDTFDYKPELEKHAGQKLDLRDARKMAKTGITGAETVMKSPWAFRQYEQSGQWVSELFPEIA